MLEILLLVHLCKRIGLGLRAKGHRAGWYQLLVVLAWFGGEFFGAFTVGIVLAIVSPAANPHWGALYLASIGCAALAVSFVFWIARMQPDLRAEWDASGASELSISAPLSPAKDSGNPYQSPT